jgi:glycosyltransferase involved in cell wall biosynthesis
MKILQVVSTPPFAWATGGCARIVFDLSKALVKKGHDITILTTDLFQPGQPYPFRKTIEIIDGVKIIRFPNISDTLAWRYKFYFSYQYIQYLKKNVKEFDIVHLQDLISIHAIFTKKYCKKFKIPYILSTHGSAFWLGERKITHRLFYLLWGKNILIEAPKLLVLNEAEQDACRNLGYPLQSIEIIYNFLDPQYLHTSQESRNDFREKYSINLNSKVVLYIGRLEKTKGLDILLDSFHNLTNEPIDVVLVIAGPDDGFEHYLKAKVMELHLNEKVRFTGFLNDADKLHAYQSADVHVSPREWEPFGITLLESCACGTPVICCKNSGIAHIIEGNVGLTFEYNQQSLKEVMIRMLTDRKMTLKFKEECDNLIKTQFSSEAIVSHIETIYQQEKSIGEKKK